MKDYRLSHLEKRKSDQYESVIYSENSYDSVVWKWEQKILLQEVQELKKNSAHVYCLDFACGTGRILSFIEQFVNKSVGIDNSEAMLAVAKTKIKKSTLVHSDITISDIIPDEKFDIITAFRFFLNAQPQLRHSAFDIITSKLRNKDSIFIFNIHGNLFSHRIFTKIWYFVVGKKLNALSYWYTKRLVLQHGMVVEKIYGFGIIPKVFYRFLNGEIMFAIDKFLSKMPFLKYFSYNLIFITRRADGTE